MINENWKIVSTVLCCGTHKGDESGINTAKDFQDKWTESNITNSQAVTLVSTATQNCRYYFLIFINHMTCYSHVVMFGDLPLKPHILP